MLSQTNINIFKEIIHKIILENMPYIVYVVYALSKS